MFERCHWCGNDPVYIKYHDTEWGVPEWDSRALYEKLVLDGFQAGLSWITILKKRDNFQKAFSGFQPEKVARFSKNDVERLMRDKGIVRSRSKIESAILGAKLWCNLRDKGEDFSYLLWKFVDGTPIQNRFQCHSEVPTQTDLSQAISRELKSLGFKFCGPVITYAFMQAVGIVNDHLVTCFRHEAVQSITGQSKPSCLKLTVRSRPTMI